MRRRLTDVLPSKGDFASAMQRVSENPFAINAIIAMVAKTIAEHLSVASAATEAEKDQLALEIAKIVGFVYFGKVASGVTGSMVNVASNSDEEIRTANVISSYLFAATGVVVDILMFSPGAKMAKFGPWMIAAVAMAANLLMQFVTQPSTESRVEGEEDPTARNDTFIAKFTRFAGHELFLIVTAFFPIAIAEMMRERAANAESSNFLKEHVNVLSTMMWGFSILANTIPAAMGALNNKMTKGTASLMQWMLIMSTTAMAAFVINAVGNNNGEISDWAPDFARISALAAIMSARGMLSQANPLHPRVQRVLENGSRGVNVAAFSLASFAEYLAILLMLASRSVVASTDANSPVNALYRKTGEVNAYVGSALVAIGCARTLHRRHASRSEMTVSGVLNMLALFFAALSSTEYFGNIGGLDIRPILFALSMTMAFFAAVHSAVTGNRLVAQGNMHLAPAEQRGLLQSVTATRNEDNESAEGTPPVLSRHADQLDHIAVGTPVGWRETAIRGMKQVAGMFGSFNGTQPQRLGYNNDSRLAAQATVAQVRSAHTR